MLASERRYSPRLSYVQIENLIQTEVTVIEKTKDQLFVCDKEDHECDYPLWVPRRKIRVIEGKLSKFEVITIEIEEDLAIELGISY